MKWKVGTKIGVGFGIALVLFVIVGAVAYRAVVKQTEAAEWVDHTHQVKDELSGVLENLQDAETGQRGFLITGVDSYLEPYTQGIADIGQHREELARLVSDNPKQQARLTALAPLIADKLAELQETISARRL